MSNVGNNRRGTKSLEQIKTIRVLTEIAKYSRSPKEMMIYLDSLEGKRFGKLAVNPENF